MDDNHKGLILALSSSAFIGASFIVKKKGLRKAGSTGVRAVIVGEAANFTAYAFAPAILVTPLGALSIIVSAVLAHIMLNEKLHVLGMLGCVLCCVGSTMIVLHAPAERQIESVKQVAQLAMEPAFVLYSVSVVAVVVLLIFHFVPKYGHTHIMVYIGICSLMGSLSVMSCKALGIAVKLTLGGDNQLMYPETSIFAMVVATCVLTQISYLNKDWDRQTGTQIVSELCGFVTILSGTFLLHATKDHSDVSPAISGYTGLANPLGARPSLTGKRPEDERSADELPLRRDSFSNSPSFRTP
eukprot:jgi/Mesen1/5942/ME000301S05063